MHWNMLVIIIGHILQVLSKKKIERKIFIFIVEHLVVNKIFLNMILQAMSKLIS